MTGPMIIDLAKSFGGLNADLTKRKRGGVWTAADEAKINRDGRGRFAEKRDQMIGILGAIDSEQRRDATRQMDDFLSGLVREHKAENTKLGSAILGMVGAEAVVRGSRGRNADFDRLTAEAAARPPAGADDAYQSMQGTFAAVGRRTGSKARQDQSMLFPAEEMHGSKAWRINEITEQLRTTTDPAERKRLTVERTRLAAERMGIPNPAKPLTATGRGKQVPQEALDEMDAMMAKPKSGDRERMEQLLSGMTIAQMKDFAGARGIVMPAGDKKQKISQLVESTVGFRLNSEAIRGGLKSGKLGDSSGVDRFERQAAESMAERAHRDAENLAVGLAPEQQIRDAYEKLKREPGDWVPLADLREELERHGLSRKDADAALEEMGSRHPNVYLIPWDNRKVLRQRDHDASLRFGGDDNHVIRIDAFSRDPAKPLRAKGKLDLTAAHAELDQIAAMEEPGKPLRRGKAPGEHLTRKLEAEIDAIIANPKSGDRERLRAHFGTMRGAELRAEAKKRGASISGVNRNDQIVDRIIEHEIGWKLNSNVIRNSPWTTHADAISQKGNLVAELGALPVEQASLEKAEQMLRGLKVAELKALAGEVGPTVMIPRGARKDEMVRAIVQGTVGFRLKSQIRGEGWQQTSNERIADLRRKQLPTSRDLAQPSRSSTQLLSELEALDLDDAAAVQLAVDLGVPRARVMKTRKSAFEGIASFYGTEFLPGSRQARIDAERPRVEAFAQGLGRFGADRAAVEKAIEDENLTIAELGILAEETHTPLGKIGQFGQSARTKEEKIAAIAQNVAAKSGRGGIR